MKAKFLFAIILTGLALLASIYVFISKGISSDFSWWRFSFSLTAVIGFGTFLFLVVKQKLKN